MNISINGSLPKFPLYGGPFAFMMLFISSAGLLFNLLIILATIQKGSNLKQKCNYLISLLAMFDFVTCIGFFQLAIQIIFGWHWMPNTHCVYANTTMLFSIDVGTFLIWSVALDRLFALKWSMMYDAWQSRSYCFYMVLPSIVFGFMLTAYAWSCSSATVIVPVCVPPTAFNGDSLKAFVFSNLMLNIAVIITNAWSYRVSATTPDDPSVSSETATMLKRTSESIVMVSMVYVATWFTTIVTLAVVQAVDPSPSVSFHISLYVGCLAAINVACNGLIYGIRSSHYRKEYKKLFKNKVLPITKNPTQLNTMPPVNIP